jgi:hypothetical protein
MTALSDNDREAREIIETVHGALSRAIDDAIVRLGDGGSDPAVAIRRGAALLVAEVSRVLAAAADQGRAADSRTFEAMFDVNAASSHFQVALDQGVHHAAEEIAKDGYVPACALVLAASRALDSVADILKTG